MVEGILSDSRRFARNREVSDSRKKTNILSTEDFRPRKHIIIIHDADLQSLLSLYRDRIVRQMVRTGLLAEA